MRSVRFVFPSFHRRGGVERSIVELSSRLSDRYDLTLVGDHCDPGDIGNARFSRIPEHPTTGAFAPLSFRRRAARHLADLPAGVTVSFGADCPPGDVLWVNSVHRAWLANGQPFPTPIGTVPNAVRYAMPRHRVLLEVERRYFSSEPDAVVAVSQQTATEVIDLYGVDPAIVSTIPNGYAAGEFSPDRRGDERTAARAQLGLADDDVVLLLVANELHRKGFKTLVEAAAIVDDPRVQVHVVGRADIRPYAALIENLGLVDRVHWHGPSTDVGHWLAIGDVFVMPTQYEAYPLVVVESLASGLPVITTAVAGSAEAIQPGVNGLLQHDPMDADELAGLLRQALEPTARAAWSSAAPATVVDQEWTVLADRCAEVIESAFTARPHLA